MTVGDWRRKYPSYSDFVNCDVWPHSYITLEPTKDSQCGFCGKKHTKARPLESQTFAMRGMFGHAECWEAYNKSWQEYYTGHKG